MTRRTRINSLPINPSGLSVVTAGSVQGAIQQLDAGAVDYDAITALIQTNTDAITTTNATVASNATAIANNTAQLGAQLTLTIHGSTASFARPITAGPVLWFGSVSPTNCMTNDLYYNTGNNTMTLTVAASTTPAVVLGFTATGGDTSVSASWTANTDAYTDHYEIAFDTVNPPVASASTTAAGESVSSLSFAGKTNGTTYYTRIRAVNADGSKTSAWSSTVSVAPVAASGSGPITSGLVVQWETTTLTGQTDGSLISGNWIDSIANYSLGAGNKPTYVASAPTTGKPALSFNGTSQYMAETVSTIPAACTKIIVAKLNTTATATMITTYSNGNRQITATSSTSAMLINGGTVLTSSTIVDTNWHVFVARFNGSSSSAGVDATGTVGNAGSNTGTGHYLGRNNSGSAFTSEYVHGIYDYSRVLSDAEVAQEVAYLKSHWGF